MSVLATDAEPRAQPRPVAGVRYALELAALSIGYFLAAKFGLSLAFTTRQVTAVWPPSGVAVAALFVLGLRAWPALFLGALAANVTANEPALTAAGIAVGNTVSPVLAVWLLRRRAHFVGTFASFRDVFSLVLVAFSSMLVSATNGVAQLALAGIVAWRSYLSVWWVWWLGDAMGVLLLSPFLLTWVSNPRLGWKGARLFELGALVVSLFVVSSAVFATGLFGAKVTDYQLKYAAFPFVIWAGLRFGAREAASSVLLVSGVALWAAIHDRGPFGARAFNLDERVLLLELFMLIVSITGLTLAAATAERDRAEALLREANAELDSRVKERTAELFASNAELAAKNAELETFVYIVSHDLRGPIVNIQGFSKELSASFRELERETERVTGNAFVSPVAQRILHEDIPGSLRYISASSSKLQRLTEALISLSRLGRHEYAREFVDVSALVRTTLDAMRQTIDQSGARISVAQLPPALGDSTALGQVFANLIGNALKYRDPERASVIEIGGTREGTHAHYFVKDNGAGIPEHAHQRLFQVFQRFHPDMAPGDGMGLAIVKRVVQRHGGKVWVESREGVGTTFHLSLPAEGLCS